MANISHFTQTVNGISTTYDIHDANAIPRSGGAVMTGHVLGRAVNNSQLQLCGATNYSVGASAILYGKDTTGLNGMFRVRAAISGMEYTDLCGWPNGTLTWGSKNVAMQEDTVPRSGGNVLTGTTLFRTANDIYMAYGGGTGWSDGAYIQMNGANNTSGEGIIRLVPISLGTFKEMILKPDGTWTWDGTACQITSDQRFKQQIDAIDDKLLDAWEDVNLVQFKYNDAVEQKGDKARLHTGYVVQQIQKACESHGVDISAYGLFCHEEYPEETKEVEVENEDGAKTKERKVIREASEHYSLRYTEALIVECKYLRKCIKELRNEIEELKSSK